MNDLFDTPTQNHKTEPLAYRMAPRNLDEYIGQSHVLSEGKLLRRAIDSDRITSLILYGPPGTGKTALARIIASKTKAHFQWLNATTLNIEEIRKNLAFARQRRNKGEKTILFIDEIHRLNRVSQDALLPDIEEGNIILIGATIENPFFYLNSALLSRSHVFELKHLLEEDIITILTRALKDKERGFGNVKIDITPEALSHIAKSSDGDARKALSALEIAVLTTQPDKDGIIKIDTKIAEESIQKKHIVYDRSGDEHYDTASAFIKSMRGSDPDATVYWLAKMIYAGEDPRFIARRIIIAASEDVGIADPMALIVATQASQAVEIIGMPEARIILAHAALYVALAPKSNACYRAIEEALKDIETGMTLPVPEHLKDANYPGAKKLGHGKGYKYPHDYGGYVKQDYLPEKKKYYKP
ncbi:MAG TPA: replication-associated recombination protein A [Thermodesulfovibrio thiophilus]|uniref:replication-associated recombination protein A n=1 Tax=Thermodesulfovibrio thiophilus TaxID=340095 RepID=UPI0003F8033D|nr:replication-associated recombination protein A [Thermodesulfovibrio thiophilus]HHW20411.1 replication-associated recombination protein A [Thermodesulfovibrio thiophilus]HOA83584.1 replication-associated recombination protein A [Thermodesulfovibrio thiophilus]HQA04245.1 replication-associated recombination protein A [Thermodesulfovibrio thiophilus]HQD36774.1 replication-associated recombination protein A [Thermodesulfovibrio thiophilus]